MSVTISISKCFAGQLQLLLDRSGEWLFSNERDSSRRQWVYQENAVTTPPALKLNCLCQQKKVKSRVNEGRVVSHMEVAYGLTEFERYMMPGSLELLKALKKCKWYFYTLYFLRLTTTFN